MARTLSHACSTLTALANIACSRRKSPTSFRVLRPDVGSERTMNTWLVGSEIPRRTSCANYARQMKTGEEIAAELQISPATLYNWWRLHGGMDTPAAPLKGSRNYASRTLASSGCLAEAESEEDASREVATGKS